VSISSHLPAPAPGSEWHVRHLTLELNTSESSSATETASTFFSRAEGLEFAHPFVLVPWPEKEKAPGVKESLLAPLFAGPR